MSIINKQTISTLFTNLRTIFNNALKNATPVWPEIAMTVQSSTKTEDYAWLSNFPRLRRWIGDKAVNSLSAFDYTIKNEDFEATVEVARNDIEDDRLGIYGPQAQAVGASAIAWPEELVFGLIEKGTTEKCYDGKPFFAADHPVGDLTKVAVSNLGDAPLSIASQAAAMASFGAARIAMQSLKDDQGRPLAINPNVLLVPPALQDIANALMTTDRLEDGKPNPYKGAAKVVVGPYLTSTTAWYLLDTTQVIKPFIFQQRKAPVFVSQTNMDADDVFMRGKYKFGVEARGNAGFGFWQLAYCSTGTAALPAPKAEEEDKDNSPSDALKQELDQAQQQLAQQQADFTKQQEELTKQTQAAQLAVEQAKAAQEAAEAKAKQVEEKAAQVQAELEAAKANAQPDTPPVKGNGK